MQLLVEGFEPDAIALAAHLVGGADEVLLAGAGDAPAAALALRREGVVVVPRADLDAEPGAPDVAYLDVWTPEVAPRVVRWRSTGTRLSCLSDLLLERVGEATVGITGSAGKSTTTAFLIQLLRACGVPTSASTRARSGNLWATEELVSLLEPSAPTSGVLALELTSSHLAYCSASPHVAVVTSFWADHVELHGSLVAYRTAKEAIVRHQAGGAEVVVNADDPAAASFAEATAARPWLVSARGPVDHGIGVVDDVAIAFLEDGAIPLDVGRPSATQGMAILLAAAAALAVGVSPEVLAGALEGLEALPHRAAVVGRRGATLLIDDSMAATPSKSAATFATFPERSVIAVVGGELESAGLRVHASPEEIALLDAACAIVGRSARAVVAFGPAAGSFAGRLRVEAEAETIDDAIAAALATSDGAAAVVVSPMYPIAPADRVRIAGLLRE